MTEEQLPAPADGFLRFCRSRVRVGDLEPRPAAVLLAGESRRDQPAGAGHPTPQTRQLPPGSLLTHDPLLVLRPPRETQLHGAGGQNQVGSPGLFLLIVLIEFS